MKAFTCRECLNILPVEIKVKDYNWCKPCRSGYYKQRRLNNLEHEQRLDRESRKRAIEKDPDKYVRAHMKYNYNITLEEANSIKANGCNICGTFEDLCIDHKHSTNKVRGCLCKKCNLALGHVENNMDLLHKMLSYLETEQI